MSPLDKLKTLEWTSPLTLKDPVVFREQGRQFIIRTLRQVKDRIMARLEMDDDNMMRPFDALPWNVQQQIQERLAR